MRINCYCLGMASVLCIFACRRSHSASLGSLLPPAIPFTHARGTGHGETTQELIGTLPPAPARHNKREREQVACAVSYCPFVAIQPLLAALTTLSVCLGSAITESGWNVATEDACNTPSASTAPAHSAPVRITPRSCQSSVTAGEAATAPEASGPVAAGAAPVGYRQHHRRPTR